MKITCDVIQDLMPSYIDGILSEDSRALVEEHMGKQIYSDVELQKRTKILLKKNLKN